MRAIWNKKNLWSVYRSIFRYINQVFWKPGGTHVFFNSLSGGSSMSTKGVHVDRLTRAMMRRSIRLLDMEYKPSEIAQELGATKAQVMRLITAGAPARKDANGHFWIHGESLADWLERAAPKNIKAPTIFKDDECYCVGCHQVMPFTETKRRRNLVTGTCSRGHKVSRFISINKKRK
jgi:hypothetical protein